MENISFEKIKNAAISSLKKPGGGGKNSLPKRGSNELSTIFLFRHSQTFDNARKIFSGRRESVLTGEGIKQAKVLAEKLKNKKIDLFIISPLKRCLQTTKEVKLYHRKSEIIREKLLLERNYGDLTGRSKEKLMKKDFKNAVLYRRSYDVVPPGGESLKDVQVKRVYPFCKDLVYKLKQQKLNIAICCTNNTMRIIRMFFEKLSIEKMLTLENPFNDYASYVVK